MIITKINKEKYKNVIEKIDWHLEKIFIDENRRLKAIPFPEDILSDVLVELGIKRDF